MGEDKSLMEVEGEAFIQRVAMTLAEAGLEPIRISVGSPEDIDSYGKVLDSSLQVEWVIDSSPYAGPIEAILEALSDPFCHDPLTLLLCYADSLAENELCGVGKYGGGTYTAEGITKLCEGLKGSAVTSLK